MKCTVCQQEMLTAKGCVRKDENIPCDQDECGDCCAREGEPHHPGCDMEECIACGGQRFICGCP